MRIVNRILAMARVMRLGRQLREIERASMALPRGMQRQLATIVLREMAQAGRCEFPHLYGTPPEERYSPWGSGTEIGIARVRSDNPQVRMRGIGLWLAVAFHETREAELQGAGDLHRQVLRVLRQLKAHLDRGRAEDATGVAEGSAAAA